MNKDILSALQKDFRSTYGQVPSVAAYAPGRVEILGNHTDYNEGFVLSAAIDRGTFFLAAASATRECRLMAADVREQVIFPIDSTKPVKTCQWANYVIGTLAGLFPKNQPEHGFLGMFMGDLPVGSGLSSSAALEISSALAFCKLYGVNPDPLTLAKIGQKAEHEYVGTKCGLLDQISSLFGRPSSLVLSDFRSLDIQTLPLPKDAMFLLCNTHAKHSLVTSEYNERRATCEKAARSLGILLERPVRALRDVSWNEFLKCRAKLPAGEAKRAAHVIGENDRVQKALPLLKAGDLPAFGKLLFDSHQSSVENFENSCPELDTVVNAARKIPEILGARLSGGGFGGSAVVLVRKNDADHVSTAIAKSYAAVYGKPCDILAVVASEGAKMVTPE
jgi:galactokinase